MDEFKKAIAKYLEELAAKDPLFAEHFKKEKKTIDECVKYVIKTVKESGRMGFDDEEVYSMAVHYYVEDEIKKPDDFLNQVKIVMNYNMNEQEKEEARKKAILEYQEQIKKEISKPTKQPVKKETPVQPSLF